VAQDPSDAPGSVKSASSGTDGARGVEFLEWDAVFLEDQAESMYRMHYWIKWAQTLTEHDTRAPAAAEIAAKTFTDMAALVPTRIQFK
jgi:hypothetical protein